MHRLFWIGVVLFIAALGFKLLVPFSFGIDWRGRVWGFNFVAFWVLTLLGGAFVLADAARTLASLK